MLAVCLVTLLIGQDPATSDHTSELLDRLRVPPYRYAFTIAVTASDFQAPDETEPAAAVAAAQERIAHGDDSPAAHVGLAKALARAERRAEADAEYARAHDGYAKLVEKAPDDDRSRLEYSQVLSAQQRFDESERQLRTILAHDASSWEASQALFGLIFLQRVKPLFETGQMDKVAPLLDELESLARQSLAAEPEDQHCRTKLTLCLVRALRIWIRDGSDAVLADRGLFAEAASELDEAASRWPSLPRIGAIAALVRLAPIIVPLLRDKEPAVPFALLPQSDRDEIARVEGSLLDLTHAHADCEAAWVGLAAISYARGKIGEAMQRIEQGSRSDAVTSLLEGRFVLAFTHSSWSECEQLGAALLHRADTGAHRCLIGKLHDRTGDLVAAEQDYLAATGKSDAQAEAWIGLAIVRAKRRAAMTEIDDALARAQAALEQKPSSWLAAIQLDPAVPVELSFTKAVALAAAGDAAASRQEIDRTLQFVVAMADRGPKLLTNFAEILQTYIDLWRDSREAEPAAKTAWALERLGDFHQDQHETDAALGCYRDCAVMLGSIKPEDLPDWSRLRPASCRLKQALIEIERGNNDAVLESCREAIPIEDALAHERLPNAHLRLASDYQKIASLQVRCGVHLPAFCNELAAVVETALQLEVDPQTDWAQKSLAECEQLALALLGMLWNSSESLDALDDTVTAVENRMRLVQEAALGPSTAGGARVRSLVTTFLETAAGLASRSKATDRQRPLMAHVLAAFRALADEEGAGIETLNGCAWQMLTCEPEDLRNPAAALPYAERAARLADGKHPEVLDTLALAQDANGDHRKAVATEEQAIALLPADAPADTRREYEARLAKYRAALEEKSR